MVSLECNKTLSVVAGCYIVTCDCVLDLKDRFSMETSTFEISDFQIFPIFGYF